MAAADVASFLSPAYWHSLAPWLHVDGSLLLASPSPYAVNTPQEVLQPPPSARASLVSHGVTRCPTGSLWGVARGGQRLLWDGLAAAVTALSEAGHPASCLLAYDEVWLLQSLLSDVICTTSGGNVPIGDFFVFNVRGGEAGWPPHRDRPMAAQDGEALTAAGAIADSFRADGTPRYTTAWVALSDATPEASTLYFIPRAFDPGYHRGDTVGTSPLAAALTSPEAHQRIIGLPVPRGSLLLFSHRVLHWGSAPLDGGAGGADPAPRIALSFACADPTWERPYLKRWNVDVDSGSGVEDGGGDWNGPYPPHDVRMGLVAAQGLNYHHQSPLSNERAALYVDIFQRTHDAFDPAYASRTLGVAQWARFGAAWADKGKGTPQRRPIAEDVALLFCAFAAAQEGWDASSYVDGNFGGTNE